MKRWKRIGVFLLSLLFLMEVFGCARQTEETVRDEASEQEGEYLIGIICWGGTNSLSEAVHTYMDLLEEAFPVQFEFVTLSMGFLNYKEIAEYLCAEGADAIMNVTTGSLPDILEVCEEYGVYLMQFWDMPMDTDQLLRCEESPYFLGYIKNEETTTAEAMAEALIQAGCEKVGILESYYCTQDSLVHQVRSEELVRSLEQRKEGSIQKIVRTTKEKDAILNLVAQEYELDGMILTYYPDEIFIEEIRELFGNSDMRFAYYDINEQTRDQLEREEVEMVSCGQHNVFALSFAYLYSFLSHGWEKEEMLALECDYLRLTDVEDYDNYIQYCIDEMPYDMETIREIVNGLETGTEILETYCQNYALERIVEEKSQHAQE